jgi:hypothetical protein
MGEDIYAMLSIEFDASVDRISREMFAERLAEPEYGWTPRISNVWTLMFEPRSRHSMRDTVRRHLELACQGARIKREQIKALASFGEDEPTVI